MRNESYTIDFVERTDGQLVEKITAIYGWVKFTFVREGKAIRESKESIAPVGKQPVNLNMPKALYVQMKKQIRAIFFDSKKLPANQPPEPPRLPSLARIIEQADGHYNDVVSLAKKKKLSAAKAERKLFRDSAKRLLYCQRDLPFLHPLERQHFEQLWQAGVAVLEDGLLLIKRTDQTNGQKTRIRIVSDNLDAAIRMQNHILDKYFASINDELGEIAQLEELKKTAEKIQKLLASWKTTLERGRGAIEQLLARTKAEAGKITQSLELCRNQNKVKACLKTSFLTEPVDSLKRHNPGAQSARTTAVLNRLNDRVAEIARIAPIILNRRLSLEAKLTNSQEAFKLVQKLLKKIPTSQLTEPEKIRVSLGQVLHVLGQISILPYRAQAKQAAFYLEAARLNASNANHVHGFISQAQDVLTDKPFETKPPI